MPILLIIVVTTAAFILSQYYAFRTVQGLEVLRIVYQAQHALSLRKALFDEDFTEAEKPPTDLSSFQNFFKPRSIYSVLTSKEVSILLLDDIPEYNRQIRRINATIIAMNEYAVKRSLPNRQCQLCDELPEADSIFFRRPEK
jgi:hypothetical protein